MKQESQRLLDSIIACGYKVWGVTMKTEQANDILNNVTEDYPYYIQLKNIKLPKGLARLTFTLKKDEEKV